QSRFRARLVAKFGLNLVPDLRQLLVAAQFFTRDVGHHFFVRHAETQIGALAVLQAKHVVAHHRPAPASLPDFARIERGEIKLLTDLVHFLADDPHYLLGAAIAQKQKRVNARAQLPDIAGSDEQFVARYLGICRGLAASTT